MAGDHTPQVHTCDAKTGAVRESHLSSIPNVFGFQCFGKVLGWLLWTLPLVSALSHSCLGSRFWESSALPEGMGLPPSPLEPRMLQ